MQATQSAENVTQLSNWNWKYRSGDAAKNTDRIPALKSDGPSGQLGPSGLDVAGARPRI